MDLRKTQARKEKPKKAKRKQDKPKKKKAKPKPKKKSILSKTLKRATTTDQSIYDNTQQQFLESLRGKLNNTDGRTNNLWNSYKRNLTAQSFGGSPYEMYRMREEADVLRERLERSTNHGRLRPQAFSYGTQTEQQPSTPPPRQATTPPTTPPPHSATPPNTPAPTTPPPRLRFTNLGFAVYPPIPRPRPFRGSYNTIGNGVMRLYERQPTTTANARRRVNDDTVDAIFDNREPDRKLLLLDGSGDHWYEATEANKYLKEEDDAFRTSQRANQRFEDVDAKPFKDDFDKHRSDKDTEKDRDYFEGIQKTITDGTDKETQEMERREKERYDDVVQNVITDDDPISSRTSTGYAERNHDLLGLGGMVDPFEDLDSDAEEEQSDRSWSTTSSSIALGDVTGDMSDERDDPEWTPFDDREHADDSF